MVVTESSPSPEMGSKSVAILSSLLPVEAIGELSSQITKITEQSSTRVNGQVTGCLQISVELVLAISVVHTSVFPTSVFPPLWFKAQNHKNAQDHNLLLLLHLHQLQVLLPEELARPRLARTMMEQICSLLPSAQAAQMNAAASAPLMMAARVILGSMPMVSAG